MKNSIDILDKFKDDEIINYFDKNRKEYVASSLLEEAILVSSLYKKTRKKYLVVKNNLYNAQLLYDYLLCFLDEKDVFCFFYDETVRIEALAQSKDLLAQRIDTLNNSLNNNPKIILTHTLGYTRYLTNKSLFLKHQMILVNNQQIERNKIINSLLNLGYKRVNKVLNTLEFSVRGAIIDFFGVNYDNPIRLEFLGDVIDSIRMFDVNTQRTIKIIDEVFLIPANEILIENKSYLKEKILSKLEDSKKVLAKSIYLELEENVKNDIQKLENDDLSPSFYKYLSLLEDTSTISNYFDADYAILIDYKGIVNTYNIMLKDSYDYQEEMFYLGKSLSGLISFDLMENINRKNGKNIFIKQFKEKEDDLSLNIRELVGGRGNHRLTMKLIKNFLMDDYKVYLFVSNDNQVSMIKNLLLEDRIDNQNIIIEKSSLIEGFELPLKKEVYFTSNEIFGISTHVSKYFSKYRSAVEIENYQDLNIGDYLVHDSYGIGIYKGLETIKSNNSIKDYLVLKYKNEETLYVPLEQFTLVRKYVGTEGKAPILSKLGSNEWENTKKKIKNKVKDLAINLIKLYDERTKKIGFAFSKDDDIQKEFEDSFIYEPTNDQQKAIKTIKEEMEKNTPMDVLLCGDVGFGKTEVAFVAAFKAIKDSKQVALLCPTTLLSSQHYENALERFKNFGVRIALLNRFKTLREQKEIIQDLKDGNIDLLIGTHRILSSDVDFKDLGLLIVDEEQRFGVEHKEKIKDFKKDVDVLTLSATPIPRTMQMSLIGIRTLVQLDTPPSNRLPVQTYVIEKDIRVVKEIIERELSRGGQVFYLYNRTSDINSLAYRIEKEIKNAKVGVIHGQMDKEIIENVSHAYYKNQINVLVCTTIIENGIDVANANTIIIENADRFGLAQLYQIKGRVGRSDRLAYAYLLVAPHKQLSEDAINRLKAIKEFSELGSGYKIALKDLSIRGAGDILGAQQAGFIDNVGFDLYLDLLKEAIDEEKGIIKQKEKPQVKIVQSEGYIPLSYAQIDTNKIDLYKKLEKVKDLNSLERLSAEIKDIYGKMPNNVLLLIEKKKTEILASKESIQEFKEQNDFIDIYLSKTISIKDGIGVMLFETINEIDFNNISLSFQKENIRIRIKKRNVNWINYINRILTAVEKN